MHAMPSARQMVGLLCDYAAVLMRDLQRCINLCTTLMQQTPLCAAASAPARDHCQQLEVDLNYRHVLHTAVDGDL
jgi:hypothetical protein